MRISLLIDLLRTMPKEAEVFVNGIEVSGAELVTGRVRDGYFGKSFKALPQGKAQAVVLTNTTEFSDGSVDQSRVFVP